MAPPRDTDDRHPLIPHQVNVTYNNNNSPRRPSSNSNTNTNSHMAGLVVKQQENNNNQHNDNDKNVIHVIDDPQSGKNSADFIDESFCESNNHRPDGTVLTYEQATSLIITLENTKDVIRNYIHSLEQDGGRETPAPRRKSWWGLHCWPKKRKWLYRYITVVTVSLQFLNLLILSLLDAWPKPQKERPYIVASSVTMIFLQLINLTFLMLASGRLVKQIYRNSVNSVFMAQSYGATILLFAGLYTLTYRIERHSWRFVNENLSENPVQVFILYAKFLFYSISTATLCGSDNVLPEYWYNCLFAGFQMLLSFCYFASILGSAMCHDTGPGPGGRPFPTTLPPSVSLQKPRPECNTHHHCNQQHHHPHHHPHHHQQQQHQQSPRHQQHHHHHHRPPSYQQQFQHSNSPRENFNTPTHHNVTPNPSGNKRDVCCYGSIRSYDTHPHCCLSSLHDESNHNLLLQSPTPKDDETAVSLSLKTHAGEINPSFPPDMTPLVVRFVDGAVQCPSRPSPQDLEVAVANAHHVQIDNIDPQQRNDLWSNK